MKYFSENEVISILINTCKELCKDKIYKPETYMTFREKIDERHSIELPNKHGRLIDADFYKKYAVRVHNSEGKEYIPADYIDIVPTVLEASE